MSEKVNRWLPIIISDKYVVSRSITPKVMDATKAQGEVKNGDAYFQYLRAIDLFRETKNAVYGLEAFIACGTAGIYPPNDLLDWLSDGFQQWLEKEGNFALERILGLGKIVSGNTPGLTTQELSYRNEQIIIEIRQLKESFGVSKEKAAAMVAARMATDEDPNPLTRGTIRREILPKMLASENKRGYAFQKLDDQGKLALLERYPKKAKNIKEIRDFIRRMKK